MPAPPEYSPTGHPKSSPNCGPRPAPWRSPPPGRFRCSRPADNHTLIIEFLVDDVDQVYKNLTGVVEDFVNEPTTMPWGNRSLLFRDPDGNLVNFFTPVTEAAVKRFAR
jgi:catechol 2,3-dioxygenase-like lactoylglutathione lyase family enzyme